MTDSSGVFCGFITAFHDPGLYCPYTVSLATAVPLEKYGSEALKARFLPQLLQADDEVWQGATWMTEIKGGSDLAVVAAHPGRPSGCTWAGAVADVSGQGETGHLMVSTWQGAWSSTRCTAPCVM